MADSFFFYDLETSGISARRDRIMQFGGQRTDLNLNNVGEPFNVYIRLSPDVLPDPEAILLTGLTPAKVNEQGISEAEFADLFNEQISQPQTIFVGYNNLRFDDEFIRFLNYRNFYDAYGWHWQDGSSRWDLLDMVRMTRALRPDGINWPVSEDGRPTNRLELLTHANKLDHSSAHDALSDVQATIELARLLKQKQPKLFDYLLSIRKKDKVLEIVDSHQPFIYTSSHYSSEHLHTTAVATISIDLARSTAQVYDLRHDISQYLGLDVDQLAELWKYDPDKRESQLPVKTIKLNRCPALAPLSVLDEASAKRLDLSKEATYDSFKLLKANQGAFSSKLAQVIVKLDELQEQRQTTGLARIPSVDEQLYDGFIDRTDSSLFAKARREAGGQKPPNITFKDERLNELLTLYRARNFTPSLNPDELKAWHDFIARKLFSLQKDSLFNRYKEKLAAARRQYAEDKTKSRLVNELEEYFETIASEYAAD